MELLTKGETDIDKYWIQSAQRKRQPITIYTHSKKNDATIVQTIGGVTKGIANRDDPGDKARHALMKACNYLDTAYPGRRDGRKRDFLMIDNADSLYFVGKFSKGRERLQIDGEEGWIVEMFFEKLIIQGMTKDFPIYMYVEQGSLTGWCHLEYDLKNKIPKWVKCYPDKPIGKYIGIGTGKLTQNIQNEISFLR